MHGSGSGLHLVRVLEVLPGHRAIVSTRGLRRIVRCRDASIYEELVTIEDATLSVETCNEAACKEVLKAVPYRAGQDFQLRRTG